MIYLKSTLNPNAEIVREERSFGRSRIQTRSIPKHDFSGSISEEQEKTLQMMKMILPGYTQDAINKRNSVSYGSIIEIDNIENFHEFHFRRLNILSL